MTLPELMQAQVNRLQELRKKKEQALKNGSPSSEIETIDLNILSCQDAISKYEGILSRKMQESILSTRFQNRTFKNFKSGKQDEAFNRCQEYAKAIVAGSKTGLILSGTVGTGKTHLAAAIAHYVIENGIVTKFGNITDIFQSLKDAFSTDEDIMSEIKSIPFLILDDLGKENLTEWSKTTIYSIINYRYENMLPTVITTNLSMPELQNRLGSATTSRLMEMCNYIEMRGKDYRV